jgi:purine-nucleoside/S-methyl-5'-thioadenosine phosphorylase / adenosine deaminase
MMATLVPHGGPPTYFTFAGLTALGVPHVTTSRHCEGIGPAGKGRSPFEGAAGELLEGAGLAAGRVAWARQVHGAGVARVDGAGGFAGQVDALVTTVPGVPLAIFTADCLAVVLVDPEASALAVAHVGWRGTARGAAQAAVDAVVAAGARRPRLRAAISPSIGPCCYEIDAPVIDALAAAYPEDWRSWVAPSARAGHFMLDLWAANTTLLAHAGLDPARIENPRVCTACRLDTFYSYRKGHRGRLATVAALP